MNLKLLYAFILVMLPILVNAGYYTGNDLKPFCTSDRSVEELQCLKYIEGIYDSHDSLFHIGKAKRIFCVPENTTSGQLKEIFIKYLNDHPEDLQMTASSLVIVSFADAFPCNE